MNVSLLMDNVTEWMSQPMLQLLTMAVTEKTGRGFLLSHPLLPCDDSIGLGTDLIRPELSLTKLININSTWHLETKSFSLSF